MLIVSVLSALSFLLIEEAGRVVYMKFYTPTSRGRESYYAIWLFSMYLAPLFIVLSCILNLSLKWNFVFSACFSSLVFYVFGNNSLWAALLFLSYFAALLVTISLKAAIIKIVVSYNKPT